MCMTFAITRGEAAALIAGCVIFSPFLLAAGAVYGTAVGIRGAKRSAQEHMSARSSKKTAEIRRNLVVQRILDEEDREALRMARDNSLVLFGATDEPEPSTHSNFATTATTAMRSDDAPNTASGQQQQQSLSSILQTLYDRVRRLEELEQDDIFWSPNEGHSIIENRSSLLKAYFELAMALFCSGDCGSAIGFFKKGESVVQWLKGYHRVPRTDAEGEEEEEYGEESPVTLHTRMIMLSLIYFYGVTWQLLGKYHKALGQLDYFCVLRGELGPLPEMGTPAAATNNNATGAVMGTPSQTRGNQSLKERTEEMHTTAEEEGGVTDTMAAAAAVSMDEESYKERDRENRRDSLPSPPYVARSAAAVDTGVLPGGGISVISLYEAYCKIAYNRYLAAVYHSDEEEEEEDSEKFLNSNRGAAQSSQGSNHHRMLRLALRAINQAMDMPEAKVVVVTQERSAAAGLKGEEGVTTKTIIDPVAKHIRSLILYRLACPAYVPPPLGWEIYNKEKKTEEEMKKGQHGSSPRVVVRSQFHLPHIHAALQDLLDITRTLENDDEALAVDLLAEVFSLTAQCHAVLGDKARAEAALNRALELDPLVPHFDFSSVFQNDRKSCNHQDHHAEKNVEVLVAGTAEQHSDDVEELGDDGIPVREQRENIKKKEDLTPLLFLWPLPASELAEPSQLSSHKFEQLRFRKPTYCDYCAKFVTLKQNVKEGGYRCAFCKYECHATCLDEAKTHPCYGKKKHREKGKGNSNRKEQENEPVESEDSAIHNHQLSIRKVHLCHRCGECDDFILMFSMACQCVTCNRYFHQKCVQKLSNAIVL